MDRSVKKLLEESASIGIPTAARIWQLKNDNTHTTTEQMDAQMLDALNVMRASALEGLSPTLRSVSGLTGGQAAEQLIFHSITTGASNDIEQATKLARGMITRYGMGEFGMVAMETVTNQYLGGDTTLACSPAYSEKIDEQVVALVKNAREKADRILRENEGKLHELAAFLLKKETITGEEFMAILNAKPEAGEETRAEENRPALA